MFKFSTRFLLIPLVLAVLSCSEPEQKNEAINISVLEFGTVNWTLQTIKRNQLDEENGFSLNIQPLASTQATKIALQAGATHIIVADWVWTIGQRANGFHYQFAPYSSSAGALMVPAESAIHSTNDLIGKKLGIAGGGLDKNWLFLKALSNQSNNDLDQQVEKVFGAPPLLNNLAQQRKVDALINYWHYSARLEAQGFRKLLDTHDILDLLGIKKNIPILGFVFNRSWGKKHAETVKKFLEASRQAANLICSSDKDWQATLPLTKTTDPNTQNLLRAGYCKGRIASWGGAEKTAIKKAYTVLSETSEDKLVRTVEPIPADVFWSHD
ncbi:MAG: ABC transporter substrate-binding protein [Cycloclasticus sp. symbiont of Poecilosclerida sp. M]|nr:MAG: ABC transporter substrate-binding protein [Cycloclasticus sp. symbiont of Poecilosclerida sp. M]